MNKVLFALFALLILPSFAGGKDIHGNPITGNTLFGDVDGEQTKVRDINSLAIETDPTVPSWAKEPEKPSYTAAEVGAQPSLVSGTNIKTVNGNSLLGSGNIEIQGGVTNMSEGATSLKIAPYLYEKSFDDSYPEAAAEYYASRNGGDASACASVRDGNIYSRNFDFPFDDRAEFVVRVSAGTQTLTANNQQLTTRRFASVGVAQVGTNLTEAIVTSGKWSKWYKALPGATVDGINENGVVCNINVVDGDPQTSGWHTNATSEAIHPLAAIRWILDHATNAQHAATYIAANIRFPQGWTQNYHYMIADETATYIVENGTAYPILGRPVMTNFRIAVEPPYGPGVERYNLLMNPANSITNAWFTNAYRRETNPPWVSDLADVLAYTNDIFTAWATHDKEYFRTTNPEPRITWWQTIHTSVYDISNRVLRVAVQEVNDWYTFQVPSAGGVKPDAVREIVEPMIGAAVTGKLDRVDVVKPDVEADESKAASARSARHVTDLHSYSEQSVWTHGEWPITWTQISEPTYTVLPGGSGFWSWLIYVGGSPKSFRADGKFDDVDFEYVCTADTNLHFAAEHKINFRWDGRYYGRISGGIVGYLTKLAGTTGELTSAIPGRDYTTPAQVVTVSNAVISAATNYTDAAILANEKTGTNQQIVRGLWDDELEKWDIIVELALIADSAQTASFDEYNNRITSTYARKDSIIDPALAAAVGKIADAKLTKDYVDESIAATNPAFSNAVLAVGLNIDTNSVAVLNEIAATFGDFPITGTATTVGGLLAALAAAVAWLKRKTAEIETNVGTANANLEDALNGEVN